MMNENRYHVIKDPVHGTMQFTSLEDSWVKPFIDSANFQRLRHIKQLGMGDYIFPGSVHTRFNHCLGCCYVASQIAHKIGLSEEERQLVMIACLLHDIGHGPFSHTFEDLFFQKLIRHEDWTPLFLNDYKNSEFFKRYNHHNPRHHLSPEKFQLIEDMIMHHPLDKRVLADVVSSQLDADRLDYLLRDSHFCGVGYGTFDLPWMLHCMTIVQSSQGERLGITHKGIGVVEHYLMARRLMTKNIYHHHKKLAIEFFLVSLLKHVAEDLETAKEFIEIKSTRLGLFLNAVHHFNQSIKKEIDVSKAKKAFLNENYSLYRELYDYDIFSLIKKLSEQSSDHPAVLLAKRLQYREMPKIIRLDQIDLNKAQALVADFKTKHKKTIQDWQLALIKSPHQAYSADSEEAILVVNEREMVKPLTELSMMISAISDKREQTAFLCIDQALVENKEVLLLLEKINY